MDIGSWGFKGEGRRGLELPSGSQVGVAPSGRARFRYNEATGVIEISIDNGAFSDVSSGSGWSDAGSVVSLVTDTDQVVIGGDTPAGGEKLRVIGDTLLEGAATLNDSLDVSGATSLTGGLTTSGNATSALNADFLQFYAAGSPQTIKTITGTGQGAGDPLDQLIILLANMGLLFDARTP